MAPLEIGKEEEIMVEDDTPKGYFLNALLGRGIKTGPKAFNNPGSGITCVALKYRTEDELPQMYDNDLLRTMYDSPLDQVQNRVQGGGNEKAKLIANAQNATGETLLMKICRRSLSSTPKSNTRGLQVVSLLLKAGANPMTCCDSGRNVLHDVFWTAKPPPDDVLAAMEKLVETLREHTGKDGILELMLSEDKHGYTPLDYVVPSQQPNWRKVVDTVVSWATEEALSEQSAPTLSKNNLTTLQHQQRENNTSTTNSKQQQQQQEARSVISPQGLVFNGISSSVIEIEAINRAQIKIAIDNMCPEDRRLLASLASAHASFLLSDVIDPDAAIVACSPRFMHETGYESCEVLGRNCRFLQGPGTSIAQVDLIRKALRLNATVNVSVLNYKKNGNVFLNNFLLTPLRSNDGTCTYFIGIQNCHPILIEDRRRSLAAAGYMWIDDSDLRSLSPSPEGDVSLPTNPSTNPVDSQGNLSRATSADTLVATSLQMDNSNQPLVVPTSSTHHPTNATSPKSTIHNKRKTPAKPESDTSKRIRSSPTTDSENLSKPDKTPRSTCVLS
uniref:PAS domain-containing protein n=1 Tax=Aureoumbra lagunensis TaxID=44058 RepID=A0A7S3JUY4_9STRA|mmetsp:Transcript_16699/g.25091  ORF Transcript_16699/g.25091 Transcript_16699/m.25091 type:complete len:558 (-) Transcript_16699:289-1962(-)